MAHQRQTSWRGLWRGAARNARRRNKRRISKYQRSASATAASSMALAATMARQQHRACGIGMRRRSTAAANAAAVMRPIGGIWQCSSAVAWRAIWHCLSSWPAAISGMAPAACGAGAARHQLWRIGVMARRLGAAAPARCGGWRLSAAWHWLACCPAAAMAAGVMAAAAAAWPAAHIKA